MHKTHLKSFVFEILFIGQYSLICYLIAMEYMFIMPGFGGLFSTCNKSVIKNKKITISWYPV